FLHQLELPVEGLHDLNNRVAHQNDGSRFDNVGLASFQHGDNGSFQTGNFIFRKFDDKERFPEFLSRNSLNQQRAQQEQYDSQQIHGGGYPPGIGEERSREQRDHGD